MSPKKKHAPEDEKRDGEITFTENDRRAHTAPTLDTGTLEPLRPHTEAWRQLNRLLQHSSDAGPHPPQPEDSPIHQNARVRALLGHALIERGIQLTSGQVDPETVLAMFHPAFFSSLWILANGYPKLQAELENVPGYTAWLREAMERGALPTRWGPPELIPREESSFSIANIQGVKREEEEDAPIEHGTRNENKSGNNDSDTNSNNNSNSNGVNSK